MLCHALPCEAAVVQSILPFDYPLCTQPYQRSNTNTISKAEQPLWLSGAGGGERPSGAASRRIHPRVGRARLWCGARWWRNHGVGHGGGVIMGWGDDFGRPRPCREGREGGAEARPATDGVPRDDSYHSTMSLDGSNRS